MNTHVVYKHGDDLRIYSPSFVLTIPKDRKSFSVNVMYLPYTSVVWETMYIVYDGTYYFSKSVWNGKEMIGDGIIKQSSGGIQSTVGMIPGMIDPAAVAVIDSGDGVIEYAENAISETPTALLCVDGTKCLIGPGIFVSDANEVDVKSCPADYWNMCYNGERFDIVYDRMIRLGRLLKPLV